MQEAQEAQEAAGGEVVAAEVEEVGVAVNAEQRRRRQRAELRSGHAAIRSHRFFVSIDWAATDRKQGPAPFPPFTDNTEAEADASEE